MVFRSYSKLRNGLLLVAVGALACNSSGGTSSSSSQAADSSAPGATAVATGGAHEMPAVAPDTIADLTELVPRDASLVVGLPGLETFTKAVDPAMLKLALDGASSQLAPKLGMSAPVVSKLIDSYEGAIVFVSGDLKSPKGAAAIRVKDAAAVSAALSDAKLENKGGGRWTLAGATPVHVAWLEKARVVIIANDEQPLLAALAAVARQKPSFKESPSYRVRRAGGLWLAADLGTISAGAMPGSMDAGSKLIVGLDVGDKASIGKLDLEYTQVGEQVPRLGTVLAPGPQAVLANLPAGALVALGISLKRAPGKTVADLLSELGRAGNPKLAADAAAVLQAGAHITLDDLDRALGDELAFGAYYDGPRIPDFSGSLGGQAEFAKSGALLFDIATRDDKLAFGLVDSVANAMSVQKGFKKGAAGSFSLDSGDGYLLQAAASPGRVRIVFGGATPARAALVKSGDPLSATALFKAAMKNAPAQSQLAVFADFARVTEILPQQMNPAGLQQLGDLTTALSVSLKPFDKGVDLTAESAGGAGVVAVIGTASALAIYGVRRYLASAKTSEAKNSIGAIARGAIAGYEREQASAPTHALCKSATPVPAVAPAGKKYQSSPGADFDTGSETTGWKCLRFAMSSPQYYQYDYRAGGNYKGPKRGGPDPGADGFEASAEGDLDGDGITSLFTLTGKLDPVTKTVKIAPQIFVADEFE